MSGAVLAVRDVFFILGAVLIAAAYSLVQIIIGRIVLGIGVGIAAAAQVPGSTSLVGLIIAGANLCPFSVPSRCHHVVETDPIVHPQFVFTVVC